VFFQHDELNETRPCRYIMRLKTNGFIICLVAQKKGRNVKEEKFLSHVSVVFIFLNSST
jgi:hypothetical protein